MAAQSDDSSLPAGSLRRRDFLAMSAVGGALAAVSAAGCSVTISDNASAAQDSDFALEETTVAELQLLMESGQLTSREIECIRWAALGKIEFTQTEEST